MEELRNVNNLNYKIPISPDVVAQSSSSTYNFNPNYYENVKENDIMQVDFQEGDDYIDPQNSYIRLKLKVNVSNATVYSFGWIGTNDLGDSDYYESNTGESVLNLIKHVELVTKNGECLFKENFKNEMATLRNYKINLSRKHVLSYMGGHSSYTGFPFFGANTKDTTFYIPLSEISPFFNSQLIPYKLLSGAILRLTMADPVKSIFTYTIEPSGLLSRPAPRLPLTTNAIISNVALILSEKQLYPEVKEAVNKQLNSPEGLQYSYYSNHTFAYKFPPLAQAADYTIPINLSVGKIKYISIKPTPEASIKATFCYPSATWSQMNNINGNPNQRQDLPFKIKIRLGNDVLSTYDVETIPEMYEQTSKALANISFPDCHDVDVKRNINKKSTGVIGFNDYYQYFVQGGGSTIIRQTKGTVFAFDFERTKALGISGVSTNMERLLEIDLIDYRAYNADVWYISIQYLMQADLFANGDIAVNR
jgi:hypothetical protein